jgi:hypothetical protein
MWIHEGFTTYRLLRACTWSISMAARTACDT